MSAFPYWQNRTLAWPGGKSGVTADAAHPEQTPVLPQVRQALSFPGRHIGFLQQIAQAAPWSLGVGLKPLSTLSATDENFAAGKYVAAKTFTCSFDKTQPTTSPQ